MANRMQLTGTVLKNKMQKTVIVSVARKFAHPVYKKVIERHKKYYVHSEDPIEIGTKVIIEESKPISKTKRWKVIDILDK